MGSGNHSLCCFPKNLIYDRVQENGISVLCLNWHDLFFTWKIQEYEKSAVTLNEVRHELSDKVRELSRSYWEHLWWRRQRGTRSPYRSWPSSWRETGRPPGGPTAGAAGALIGSTDQGWGGTQGPRSEPNWFPAASLEQSLEPTAPNLHRPNEWGGKGLGCRQRPLLNLLLCRLPGSRGTPVGTGWCAVLWTLPLPIREHPQRHQSSRGCGSKATTAIWRLLSRWAPAVIPSLQHTLEMTHFSVFFLCAQEIENKAYFKLEFVI